MKKVYSLLTLLICFTATAQHNLPHSIDNHLSPNGLMDKVVDHYGNHYTLSDLAIKPAHQSLLKSGTISTTIPLSCGSGGYFDLYFETGSGMEIVGNPVHDARRMVLCQVFSDLSNFIHSPLTSTGKKVNIWIRNSTNIPNCSPAILGLATAFYTLPNTTMPNVGGIIDNEVWKTIHTGNDSYTNVAAPLLSTGLNAIQSGSFYHGMMAFNFTNPAINWHTNLTSNAPIGLYDLYSVALHEVTHALGFSSLISSNGSSKFGAGFNYYSRYDRFLKTNDDLAYLLTNDNSCSMYNYTFNPALTSTILNPNPQNSACVTDNTFCGSAIHYIGTTSVPVYTPNCFEPPSSLSHFEDQCYSSGGNNTYFTMSNANGTGVTKRFLTSEERSVLCDIGYQTETTYGSTAWLNYKNYTGESCVGIPVAGINDGINANGTYTFSGDMGSPLFITDILSNDYNAVGFECLEDLSGSSTLSVNSGTSTTTVAFSSVEQGVHLLRYVPIDAAGLHGNITYIYVFVRDYLNCASPTSCNLVANGNFESYSSLPNSLSQLTYSCGWTNPTSATPDYLHTGGSYIGVPCNIFGIQQDHYGLDAYVGMWNIESVSGAPYFESIGTKLSAPLEANTSYQLHFDVSLAEGASASAIKFQAYLSTSPINTSSPGYLPISDSTMLFTYPSYSTNTSGWETISFNFTTGATAGQYYLYIGGLSNVQFNSITPVAVPPCSVVDNNSSTNWSYYYIDNISLAPSPTNTLNLPPTLCLGDSIHHLASYLSIPSNSSFSGTAVVQSGNSYSFMPSSSDLGSNVISCSYTTPIGCVSLIESTIDVIHCIQSPPCLLSPSFSYKFDETTCSYLFFSISSEENPVVEYSWNFGDGTTGNGLEQHHIFSANGLYIVCLTMTLKDEFGNIICEKTNCEKLVVDCLIKQQCDFIPQFIYYSNEKTCNYTFSAAAVNGTTVEYIWDFGDGTTDTGLTANHSYSTNGTFTTCLTVLIRNAHNEVICKKTSCEKVEINCISTCMCENIPLIKYTINKKNCAGSFTAQYIPNGCASVEYHWDFGDGVTSIGQHASHTFSKTGTYTVCLVVQIKNEAGKLVCEKSTCQLISVMCKGGIVTPVNPVNPVGPVANVIKHKSFTIYPNPASNRITLRSDFEQIHPLQLTFFSLDGKIIQRLEQQELNESLELSIDLPNSFPEGCIFLEIVTEEQTTVEKIIRVR